MLILYQTIFRQSLLFFLNNTLSNHDNSTLPPPMSMYNFLATAQSSTITPTQPSPAKADPFAAFMAANNKDTRCVTIRPTESTDDPKCLRQEKEKQEKAAQIAALQAQ